LHRRYMNARLNLKTLGARKEVSQARDKAGDKGGYKGGEGKKTR